MICVTLSDDLSEDTADKLISKAAQQSRISRMNFFAIIFLSKNINKVFLLRDVFTKHIDIGTRVYVENDVEKLSKILSNCSSLYLLSEDNKTIEIIKNIANSIQIIYIK